MFTEKEEKIIQCAKNPALGPQIAVIGGGTGLSTVLRGLKLFSNNLTAIVTVADNGGSSGMLREDLGILPPGDIRNCILALADTEPLMSDLLNYRFSDGRLKGQNFGNLLIAAMNAISGNFYDAVRNVSKVLAVKGRVLPVSLQDLQISARLRDGTVIDGESEIGHRTPALQNDIVELSMKPSDAKALPDAIQALSMADVIVLGPGSLYTSIIPNLLFPEIRQAIKSSQATKIYVCNLMTQPAETMGYNAAQHLKAMLNHIGQANSADFVDYCVVNNAWIDRQQIARYRLESATPVLAERGSIEALGPHMVDVPLACITNGVIRHDHMLLGRVILRLAMEHLEHQTYRHQVTELKRVAK
ncbi:MAG: YvcK family protein [Bacillota bacterium]|nr:YvcK family protein [Bacillota bacterium]